MASKTGLKIINDAPGMGAYIGQHCYGAPEVLIMADSFESAEGIYFESLCARGALDAVILGPDEDDADLTWVDGWGYVFVVDTYRVWTVRHSPRD